MITNLLMKRAYSSKQKLMKLNRFQLHGFINDNKEVLCLLSVLKTSDSEIIHEP